MASKLTQAEKQRRAGVRACLRVLNQQSRKAEWLIETLALEEAKVAIRALLAPKSQHNFEKLRRSKKRGKGARG